ncbi:hypothetical protein FOXB_03326 [Fusarium oxysporum f. sp. conglutinans Fo5176]|uniref:Uncharacterized protein n=1 Tax=Fusarium oxysporum (strain Fo5176) TaxID=660025 RepID=F9FAA0_FUSOF|nr:hypothetical protein FOXB_03326 [Fusarium oxysporum f. sp. conglutinans Fo5176]
MVVQETDWLSVGHIVDLFHRLVYSRAEHDEGCTCLTNPSTTRCTIDESLFMDLLPDVIRSLKRDGICSRDNISMLQTEITGRVGPLALGMTPHSAARTEAGTESSSTPSISEASGIETMSTHKTMNDVRSLLFSQSDTVVESRQPEFPQPASPLKPSKDSKPSRKPGKIARMKLKLLPDRSKAFKIAWGVFDELESRKERARNTGLSTSLVKRLFIRLRDGEKMITRIGNKFNLTLINFRIDAILLKLKHREIAVRHWKISIDKHPKKRRRMKHPDECRRPQSDTALDEITRECYDMGLGDDLRSGNDKILREQLRRYINVGEFCSNLIKELGWGAMLVPGLLIRQDEQELVNISPAIFILMSQGVPRSQTLELLTRPSGSRCEAIDPSLNAWLRFKPTANEKPVQALESLYTQEEQDQLRELPCPEKEVFGQTSNISNQ